MTRLRPNLVGCWVFRQRADGALEILLLKRAPGRIFAGVWQCVTGGLEADERVVDGALRELVEETGFGADDLEVVYGLDQVNLFHADHVDAIEVEAVFAVRVATDAEPRRSEEHDDHRWVLPDEATAMVIWPAYRAAIGQLEWLAAHPEHEPYLRVDAWAIDAARMPSFAPPDPTADPPADGASR